VVSRRRERSGRCVPVCNWACPPEYPRPVTMVGLCWCQHAHTDVGKRKGICAYRKSEYEYKLTMRPAYAIPVSHVWISVRPGAQLSTRSLMIENYPTSADFPPLERFLFFGKGGRRYNVFNLGILLLDVRVGGWRTGGPCGSRLGGDMVAGAEALH
jgi:hypothetical protein